MKMLFLNITEDALFGWFIGSEKGANPGLSRPSRRLACFFSPGEANSPAVLALKANIHGYLDEARRSFFFFCLGIVQRYTSRRSMKHAPWIGFQCSTDFPASFSQGAEPELHASHADP